MSHLPPELRQKILKTEEVGAMIRALRSRERQTLADLKKMVLLRSRLLDLCPPERFAWIEGVPVIDILKTLAQQEPEILHEKIK